MLMRIDYHDADGLLLPAFPALQPLTPAGTLPALLRQPMLTLGIIARIHWQALRLWLKKCRFSASRRPNTH
jgi:DUF1365 family protein